MNPFLEFFYRKNTIVIIGKEFLKSNLKLWQWSLDYGKSIQGENS